MAKHTVKIDDRVWPSLYVGDIERILMYGTPAEITGIRFTASSIVAAYRALLTLPVKDRNDIINRIVAASNDDGDRGQ
jgi:hypothetical protein